MTKNTECLNTTNTVFPNVHNTVLTMLPLFLIHEDVPKACLKSFILSK